jgi:hypothetical protein
MRRMEPSSREAKRRGDPGNLRAPDVPVDCFASLAMTIGDSAQSGWGLANGNGVVHNLTLGRGIFLFESLVTY